MVNRMVQEYASGGAYSTGVNWKSRLVLKTVASALHRIGCVTISVCIVDGIDLAWASWKSYLWSTRNGLRDYIFLFF